MKYPRIISAVRSAKWAILPQSLSAIVQTLGCAVRGDMPLPELEAEETDGPEIKSFNNVAIIPIHGIIGKRLSAMETECGGCDVDTIEDMLEAAMEDQNVECIVFDINSPGGCVTGVPELADKIREAGQVKHTIAWTDTMACSAAYWLGSQCNQFVASESADIGSIGVYVAMIDDSGAWAQNGYKLELIKAGDFKATGISGAPITNDQRTLIQSDVDAIYADFCADVTAGRPSVQPETMQGQTFMGKAALAAGLVDAVDPSFMRDLCKTEQG
jgi:signal peptide peptidase SppA